VSQPKLKKREGQLDHSALTFSEPREEAEQTDDAQPMTEAQAVIRQRIQGLEIAVAEDLLHASAVVKRTAMRLKRRWRKEIIWNRGERSGPTIRVDVSEGAADRALQLCDLLVQGTSLMGWSFQAQPRPEESPRAYRYQPAPAETPMFGNFTVDGEPLEVRIDERRRRIDHVPTEEEKAKRRRGEYVYAPRWDYLDTGELRLHLSKADSSYGLKTWKDGARKRIEEDIKSILITMGDEALRIKMDREERRLAEIEERRQEKLRWQLEARREANAKLIRELEAQAGAWFRARVLRSYVRAVRKSVGDTRLEARLQNEHVDFVAWAEHYIDQLDPLTTTPHDPDLEEERPMYRSTSEGVQESVSRLLGREWQTAWKNSECGSERRESLRVSPNGEDDMDGE
jgi:hypothetical protein